MNDELIVIGGGAAGMMAAVTAARAGVSVRLLEPNEKLGRKLYITGKGRCNLTNHCSAEEVMAAVVTNRRFLYSALSRTPPQWVEEFFEDLGVPLKTERGGRVFPQSDRAADVIDALFYELRRLKVAVVQDRAVELVATDGRVTAVRGEKKSYPCSAAVLATGGLSYPGTGSTGDGFRLAQGLGHTLIAPRGSLVPLETEGTLCQRMQGLTLKNVELTVRGGKKKVVYQEQGELLFTHFGISGPLVLSASAHMQDWAGTDYTCTVDLKPALSEEELDARLLREFKEESNRNLGNILPKLLPRLMVEPFGDCTGVSLDRKGRDLTREERRALLETFKRFPLPVKGPRPIAEAIVTAGGIKVGEIDPKTMESKRVDGLYLAGELLDVDALTGGYNLQIAWATGRAAGESAAERILTEHP